MSRLYKPHEISLLVEHFPDLDALVDLLQGRTRDSIASQGRRRGLGRIASPNWTIQEERIVSTHYPDITRIQILLPNRTGEGIRTRARKMGLCPSKRTWTAERRALLSKLAGKISNREAAKILGGSSRGVDYQREKMGLITRKSAVRPLAAVPLVQDILDEAHRKRIALCTVARELGCQKLKPSLTERHLSMTSAAKVVSALGGHLYVEWTD